MSKSKSMVLIALVLLISLSLGLVLFVKTKLKPEIVRSMVVKSVEEALPGAEVQLSSVNLSFGLNIGIDLLGFNLKTKNSKQDLFSVDNFHIKVPLWSIITGGGVVEVFVEKPSLSYFDSPNENNWKQAIGKNASLQDPYLENKAENEKVSTEIDKEISNSDSLKSILKRISVNLNVSDLNFQYSLKDKESGNVLISKFLIKGLNFEANTAYELVSNFKLNLPGNEKAAFDLLVIGQFNLSEIIFQNEVRSKTVVHLKNVTFDKAKIFISEVKTDLEIYINKEKELKGSALLNFGSSNIATNIVGTVSSPTLDKIKVDILLEELASLINFKNDNISFGKSRFQMDGTISMNDSVVTPDIKFLLVDHIAFKDSLMSANIGFNGSYKKDDYDLNILVDIFGGAINTSAKGKIDLNKLPEDFSLLPPFAIKIGGSKVAVSKEILQKIIYSEKVAKSSEVDKSVPIENMKTKAKEATKPLSLPRGNIGILLDSVNIDSVPLYLDLKAEIKSNNIEVKGGLLKYSEGTAVINTKVTPVTMQNINGTFDVNLKGLNMKGLSPFLPKLVSGVSGLFTGALQGTFHLGEKVNYNVNVDISAKSGEVKGINFKDKVIALFEKVPQLKEKINSSNVSIDQNFENLDFKGNLSETEYKIDKFIFLGISNKVNIKSNGIVYTPESGKSGEVFLTYNDNEGKVSELLNSNFGTKELPLRLVGAGFSLTPDYIYTSEKLAKGFIKSKGKEIVKKEIEKTLEKVLEDKVDSKQVNKLLKGLFKK